MYWTWCSAMETVFRGGWCWTPAPIWQIQKQLGQGKHLAMVTTKGDLGTKFRGSVHLTCYSACGLMRRRQACLKNGAPGWSALQGLYAQMTILRSPWGVVRCGILKSVRPQKKSAKRTLTGRTNTQRRVLATPGERERTRPGSSICKLNKLKHFLPHLTQFFWYQNFSSSYLYQLRGHLKTN